MDKVVPINYYSDVTIDKNTPYKKVARFCKINPIPKEDNELYEI